MFNILGLVLSLLLTSALDCSVFADVNKHADTASGKTVLSLQKSFSFEPWRKFQGVFQSMEILAQEEEKVRVENVQHKIRRSGDFVEEGLETPLWYLYNRLDMKGTSFKQTITWQNKSAKTQTVKLTLRHKAPFSRILWDDKRYDLAELTEPLKLKAYQTETLLTDSRKEKFPVIPLKRIQGYALSFLDEQGRFKGNFSWLDMVNQDQNPEVLVYLAAATAPDESHLMVVDLVFEFEVMAGSSYVLDPNYDLANMQPGDTVVFGAEGVVAVGIYDRAGWSVASGDFNSDGKSDAIIGAPLADSLANGRDGAGEVYVIYGKTTPPATIDLANLSPSDGLIIYGADAFGDGAGYSVSAGDINGDGKSDAIIGVSYAHSFNNSRVAAGEVYVIYGKTTPPATIDLLSLAATDGLIIYGADGDDYAGKSVSAGDFNGDGKSDIVIGAPFADSLANGRVNAGEVYVIYGKTTPPATIDLLSLAATDGLIIYGAENSDFTGVSVSAGDFNGDGKSDVIVGADRADGYLNAQTDAGEVYVIYGSASPPATIDLLSLAATDGLIIYGAGNSYFTGASVAAGDFNGDGKFDVVADFTSSSAGPSVPTAYIIYGSPTPPATINLATLTSSQGLLIMASSDACYNCAQQKHDEVSSSDLNGDGKYEVFIGNSNNGGGNSSAVYVIYGTGARPTISTSFPAFNGKFGIDPVSWPFRGMTVYGADVGDQAGYSVSAGDFAGSGTSSYLIIGAPKGDSITNSRFDAGEVSVINLASYVPAPDYTAPATINNFTATTLAANSGAVNLTWTAPGDDGNVGILNGLYRIQYATFTITWNTETTPSGAFTKTVSTANVTPGSNQSFLITDFTLGATFYFRIWSQDEPGNWSNISNGATATVKTWLSAWKSDVSENTSSVAWGDYDGDGDLDLAVGNSFYPVRIYQNNSGSLATTSVWNPIETDSTYSIAWGDYDGDGDLDLAVGNWWGPNRLYRNDNGSLTTTSVWNPQETGQTNSIAWGDYDNDGDLDLAVGNNGTNRIYENTGSSLTATSVWNSAENENTTSVAWGDFDNDGYIDLAVGNYFGSPKRVYRNNGGSLSTTSTWNSDETNDYTQSIAWGDYDGDGDLDLAIGNSADQPNRLYRNDNGSLTTTSAWNSPEQENTYSVAWGDYDADGDLDLAVGNNSSLQPNRVYRNDGGSLTSGWYSNEMESTYSVAWGDYDGDDDLDLAVGNYNQPNRVYSASGFPSNTPPNAPNSGFVSSYANGKLTLRWGDGSDAPSETTDPDLLTYAIRVSTTSSGGNVWPRYIAGEEEIATPFMGHYYTPRSTDTPKYQRVYLSRFPQLQSNNTYYWQVRTIDTGLAQSGWSTQQQIYVPGDTEPPAAINNLSATMGSGIGEAILTWTAPGDNGNADILSGIFRIQYATFTVAWSTETTPSGAFTKTISTSSVSPGSSQSTLITDLMQGPTFYFRIWTQDDAANWSGISNGATTTVKTWYSIWQSIENEYTTSVAWGDYDGDGNLDLAVGNNSSSQPSRVYRNNGDNTFTSVWDSSPNFERTTSVAWGDYDGDGDLDLAVGNNSLSQPSRVYRNNGDNTFTSVWDSSPNFERTTSVAWGDYDNDGDLDLAVGNNSSLQPNRVYRNDGGNNFGSVWGSLENEYTTSVAWGDYDGDGDLDLAVGNDSSSQPNRVYRNDGGNNFGSVWGSLEKEYTTSVAWGDYDGDGDLDLAVGNDSFSQPNRIYNANNFTPNTPPDAPNSGFVSAYANNKITLRWGNGSDTQTTDADLLTYAIRLSTVTSGTYVQPPYIAGEEEIGSPLRGHYLTPRDIVFQDQRVFISSTIPQLQQNNTYYWQVRTIDTGLAQSPWSDQQKIYIEANPTPPSAISTLSALSGASQGEINLSWAAPGEDGVTGTLYNSTFTIQRTTYSTFSSWDPIAPPPFYAPLVHISTTNVTPGTTQTYIMSGLDPGTTYYFRIWTKDAEGLYSELSNAATAWAQVQVAAPPDPPGNPLILAVYASSITVSYSTVSANATGYILQASTVSAFDSGIIHSSSTYVNTLSTLTTPSTLSVNTTYYLRVGSLWSGGTVYIATPLSTSTLAGLVTDLQVYSIYTTSITINWTPVGTGEAQSYVMYASTNSAFDPVLQSSNTTNINISSWTTTNLYGNATYYFRVGSINHNNVANYTVTISTYLPAVLHIAVDKTTWDFGLVISTSVITSSVTVTNNSNVNVKYSLAIDSSTPTNMYPVQTYPANASLQFRMSALFNGNTAPAISNFSVANDFLAPANVNRTASAALERFEGVESGENVPVGNNRGLWLMFEAPPNNSVNPQQSIILTITAEAQ